MQLPKDLAISLIIWTICLWLFYLTTQFDSDPLGLAQGMPATHMPRLVLAVIAALVLLMLIQGVRGGAAAKLSAPPVKMWLTTGILALAATMLASLGLLLVFFAVCLSLPILWGARNYLAVGIFALALPAAIFLVFQLLLGLRLPLGPLAFLAI